LREVLSVLSPGKGGASGSLLSHLAILLDSLKRNGIHRDVFKDKIQGLHQSNTSYLF